MHSSYLRHHTCETLTWNEPVQVPMGRFQGCGSSGTAIPGQHDPRLFGGAYLSVERHFWQVLDAPDMAFLQMPYVLCQI